MSLLAVFCNIETMIHEGQQPEADLYRLQHIVSHLARANQRNRLHKLLVGEQLWMDTKFSRFGSDYAFSADLDIAIASYTDPLSCEHLLQLVAFWSAKQVISWRVQLYDDVDLETLVWLGRSVEALNQSRARSDPAKAYAGLWTIYTTLQKQKAPCIHLLPELKELALRFQDREKCAESLAAIAHEYNQRGDFLSAYSLVKLITSTSWRLITHIDILTHKWYAGERTSVEDELLTLSPEILQIEDYFGRILAYTTLAVAFNEIGKHSLAQKFLMNCQLLVISTTPSVDQLGIWMTIGKASAEIANYSQLKYCAQQILSLAGAIKPEIVGDFMLSEFVKQLIPMNVDGFITKFREAINLHWLRISTLCEEIVYLAQHSSIHQAFSLLAKVQTAIRDWDQEELDTIASILVQALVSVGEYEQAKTLVRQIKTPNQQIVGQKSLAVALARTHQYDGSQEAFLKARTLLDQAEETTHFTAVLTEVATQLARAGRQIAAEKLFAWATDWSFDIEDPVDRTHSLNQILIVYLTLGLEVQARHLIYSNGKPYHDLIATYVRFLIEKNRLNEAQALITSELATLNSVRAELLSILGKALVNNGELTRALEIGDQLELSCTMLIDILRSSVGNSGLEGRNVDPLCGRLKSYQIALDCALTVSFKRNHQLILAEKYYNRASQLCETIVSPVMKVAALGHLAACLVELEEDDEEIVHKSKELIKIIPDSSDRDEALHQYLLPFVIGENFDHVQKYLNDSPTTSQAKARRMLAETLLKRGQRTEAEAVLSTVSDADVHKQIAPLLACDWLQKKRPARALIQLGVRSPNDFLSQLALWGDVWNSYSSSHPELSLKILAVITNTLGWSNKNWKYLNTLLD